MSKIYDKLISTNFVSRIIRDKFVDTYLTKDGETVEEAKKRLKEEAQKL